MTKEDAIALYDTGFWAFMSPRDIAIFQMYEEHLCMPFTVFQEAMRKTLGRPVWTHEFGNNLDSLKDQLNSGRVPTLKMIPPQFHHLIK